MKIPLDRARWKEVKYLKINQEGPKEQHPYEYSLVLPEPLASWDVFDYWEVERTRSMKANLKQGDVLFDIGAEHGWLSVIYAKMVGAENMVLMEPTPEFWPNIRHTWIKNGLEDPRECWNGLVGADNKNYTSLVPGGWPLASETDELIDRLKYVYIHEHGEATPQITIDRFVGITGVIPDALTMDTEGAEISILRGAEQTLRDHRPLVWASVHPDLAIRDGYGDVREIHELMANLGYQGQHLATDHEEHWLFKPL